MKQEDTETAGGACGFEAEVDFEPDETSEDIAMEVNTEYTPAHDLLGVLISSVSCFPRR